MNRLDIGQLSRLARHSLSGSTSCLKIQFSCVACQVNINSFCSRRAISSQSMLSSLPAQSTLSVYRQTSQQSASCPVPLLRTHRFSHIRVPFTTMSRQISSSQDISKHDPNYGVVKVDPVKGDLVYIGTLARMVRLIKLFSLSTSAMAIGIQPLIYDQVAELPWALGLMVGGVSSFFVFVTPVLLHIITKRYVIRMYWNKTTDTFTATTYSLFIQQKDHTFKSHQAIIPASPGLFATVRVDGGKRPLFLDPNLFLSHAALIQILKYNEPLDWELPTPTSAQRSGVQDSEAQGTHNSATNKTGVEESEGKKEKQAVRQKNI